MIRLQAICALLLVSHVKATSMKMDFLRLGDVRTDPIINPTCLSDHVHTFYGANKMRPETTYEDLRAATGNTGNVQENKSLYWHPTVYKVSGSGVYTKADIWFASAYYVWETGKATAFPDGFKMVAGNNGIAEAKAGAECVGPSACERTDGGCGSDDTSFFPETACYELEVSMSFQSCWDGVRIDSEDHKSHVSYDIDGGVFDGECPSSHPVKIPQIQLFFRILNYSGGKHVFADGTSYYHADYFSGWDATFLQKVLDECSNESEAASPDAWCENHVTFLDAPKSFGDDKEDSDIVSDLLPFQPPTFDTSTITTEAIEGVTSLPRGSCTGTLVPEDGPNPTPNPPTSSPVSSPTSSPVSSPTTTNDDDACRDEDSKFELQNGARKTCKWASKKNTSKRCAKKTDDDSTVSDLCPVACQDRENPTCTPTDYVGKFEMPNGKERSCNYPLQNNGAKKEKRCRNNAIRANCPVTCEEYL